MKKNLKILLICILTVVLASGSVLAVSLEKPVRNYEGDLIEIYTAEDLFAIADDPSGRYILMNDINLDEYEWTPLVFSGSFNGNRHRILNVHINSFTEETRTVYDCNHKPYESHFAGFFGICEGAEIEYLEIYNININIENTDECIFTGLLTGYLYDSWVAADYIYGSSFLSTSGHCFGSGGIAGYGGASVIFGCSVGANLSCNDEDVSYKDEQFMGGVYALGYIDLNALTVNISGYDSDHGFVHNGGLIGSYYKYDGDNSHGMASNCFVKGKITFYEDNTNRRAYCSAYIGEVMNWSLDMDGNSEEFVRNEIFDYSKVLRPHYDCADPQMIESVIEPDYGVFGCTQHICRTCGYSYCDQYKLLLVRPESLKISAAPLGEDHVIGDQLYAGATVRIVLELKPANAYPKEIKLTASNPDAIEFKEPVAEYKEGQETVCYCDAVIKSEGQNTITVTANTEEVTEASTDINALSSAQYGKDVKKLAVKQFFGNYGIIIGAAVIVLIIAVVLFAEKNRKKSKH